ncbi:hypothetical protein AABE10_28405 [Paraburkholderia diazotrophica]
MLRNWRARHFNRYFHASKLRVKQGSNRSETPGGWTNIGCGKTRFAGMARCLWRHGLVSPALAGAYPFCWQASKRVLHLRIFVANDEAPI